LTSPFAGGRYFTSNGKQEMPINFYEAWSEKLLYLSSVSEDSEGANKSGDFAVANIFTNKNKRWMVFSHPPFILLLIQKVLSIKQRFVGTA